MHCANIESVSVALVVLTPAKSTVSREEHPLNALAKFATCDVSIPARLMVFRRLQSENMLEIVVTLEVSSGEMSTLSSDPQFPNIALTSVTFGVLMPVRLMCSRLLQPENMLVILATLDASTFERLASFRALQWLNIIVMSVTLDALRFERSMRDSDSQLLNIAAMLVTFDVSSCEISMLLRDLQPSNIDVMLVVLEVSRFERSMFLSDSQPKNSMSMLVTLDVLIP